jgi:hypothetical protein
VNGAVCIANIGPRERRKRLVSGLIALGAALLVAAVLLATGAPRPWRLVLFPALWVAGIGIFQYREKT